jgi:hypothetical protein
VDQPGTRPLRPGRSARSARPVPRACPHCHLAHSVTARLR